MRAGLFLVAFVASLALLHQCDAWYRRYDVFGEFAKCATSDGELDPNQRVYTQTDADKKITAMTNAARQALGTNHAQGYTTTPVFLDEPTKKVMIRIRTKPGTAQQKIDSVVYAFKDFAARTGLNLHDFTITLQDKAEELKPVGRDGVVQTGGKVAQQFWPPSYMSLSDAFPENSIEAANLATTTTIPSQYVKQVVIAAIHELCHFSAWKKDAIKFAASTECVPETSKDAKDKNVKRSLVSGYSQSNIAEWIAEVCTAKYFDWPKTTPEFKDDINVDVEQMYTAVGGFAIASKPVTPNQAPKDSPQSLQPNNKWVSAKPTALKTVQQSK